MLSERIQTQSLQTESIIMTILQNVKLLGQKIDQGLSGAGSGEKGLSTKGGDSMRDLF